MINALWITLIGMGLVFVAILLLWGLMALLVRLTEEREAPETAVVEAPAVETAASDTDRKRRVAAAAVAIAMAMRQPSNGHTRATGQPAGSVSAWQAVQRASRLGQQMNASRKKVVR